METCKRVLGSPWFDRFIIAVVVANCIAIGAQTYELSPETERALNIFDTCCVAIYVIEIAMRIAVEKKAFFKSGWNNFDLAIVVACLIPVGVLPVPPQIARVLRVFRSLRVFLALSALKPMRVIVASIGRSIPSVSWTIVLLLVVYYVYGVAGVDMYGEEYPQYFGNLSTAFFTLFELTTMENWISMAEDVMANHDFAWVYFLSFLLIAAYVIVNIVLGIIVNALERSSREIEEEELRATSQLQDELGQLREQLERVSAMLDTPATRKAIHEAEADADAVETR